MTAPVQELAPWFEKKFGAPLPVSLASWQLEPAREELWVSAELAGKLESPPMTPEFLEDPTQYVIAGMWGHSVNSYAMYWVERRGAHRRFFRLMCGGAYGKWEDDAKEVVAYLRGYEAFRRTWEPKLESSRLLHNMGQNAAELTLPGHEPITLNDMVSADEWWTAVGAALADAGR